MIGFSELDNNFSYSNSREQFNFMEAGSTPAWATGPGLQRKRDAAVFSPRAEAL